MPDSSDTQQRLIELETRLAFQEHALQELNLVVVRQQATIDRLSLLLKETQDRLRGIGTPVADISQETPPPHY